MKKRHHLIFWPAVSVILIDQVSKWVLVRYLSPHESIEVLPGFFNLVHVRNRGMAFGLMNRPDMDIGFYVLVTASLAAVVLLLAWTFRLKEDDRMLAWGISFILAGAVGNLIDRLRFHEVIDFLDFYLGPYHWPAFNVADSAITVGTFLVGIVLLFQHSSKR